MTRTPVVTVASWVESKSSSRQWLVKVTQCKRWSICSNSQYLCIPLVVWLYNYSTEQWGVWNFTKISSAPDLHPGPQGRKSKSLTTQNDTTTNSGNNTDSCPEELTGYCLNGGYCFYREELQTGACGCPNLYGEKRCEKVLWYAWKCTWEVFTSNVQLNI